VELPEKRVQAIGTYLSTANVSYYGYGTGRLKYVGGFTPMGLWNTWNIPAMVLTTQWIPDTTAWELQAYKKTRPRIEKASAFVFAAEMRDIPRMLRSTSRTFDELWKVMGGSTGVSKVMQPKKVADNFLNHQFGWTPFLGDLKKFHQTFQNAAAIKARLRANNDKYVVRRATLSDQESRKQISSGTGMAVEPLGDLISKLFIPGVQPTWELVEIQRSTVSAVGQYKYYRPEFDASLPDYDSAWNRIRREADIYGARISPANVYRAVPWTWLIDWCVDFGSVIDAIDDIALDALVARYLYVMRHECTTTVFLQRLPFISGPQTISWVVKSDAKVRRGASTPYGFGLSWNLLSPRQLAILAALGITRMR
jgi:hypothetical protein